MPVKRVESGRFQAIGDDACALREWTEKYIFSPPGILHCLVKVIDSSTGFKMDNFQERVGTNIVEQTRRKSSSFHP